MMMASENTAKPELETQETEKPDRMAEEKQRARALFSMDDENDDGIAVFAADVSLMPLGASVQEKEDMAQLYKAILIDTSTDEADEAEPVLQGDSTDSADTTTDDN
jgi:hypothetical protein